MQPGDLIKRTNRILAATTLAEGKVTQKMTEIFEYLTSHEGEVNVPLELPWRELQQGEQVTRHLVTAVRYDPDENRVYFYNPAAVKARPGTILGGPGDDAGPERRAEEEGLESMSLSQIARYFSDKEAFALLPEESE